MEEALGRALPPERPDDADVSHVEEELVGLEHERERVLRREPDDAKARPLIARIDAEAHELHAKVARARARTALRGEDSWSYLLRIAREAHKVRGKLDKAKYPERHAIVER